MIQRFRKCWLQDKNKLGAQLLSDLGSCSILSYIFWILNTSNPPQRPTYILSLNSHGYLRCHGLQQLRYVIHVKVAGSKSPSRTLLNATHGLHSYQLPTGLWTLLNSTRAAVLKMLWPSCLANTTSLQHLALAQFPYFNNLVCVQHFHWLSFTLLVQLLDSNKPLHHLRHRSWHGIPLLHHIIQLWHLKGYTYSLNHQVERVYFS